MILSDGVFKFFQGIKKCVDLYSYRRKIPKFVNKIRLKRKIKVLFVLSDLSLWKTETLYKAMLSHPRFEPILGLTLLTCDTPSEVIRKYYNLKNYILDNGYNFLELEGSLITKIEPDITFYQQPYDNFVSTTVDYSKIIKNGGLICDIHYSFRTLAIKKKNRRLVDLPLFRYCWQIYMENQLNLEYRRLSLIKGKNFVVTGIPFQDELSKPKELFYDPWKPQEKRKKRIIYAPHHTLPNKGNWLNLSCFLDVCDFMFEIANTLSDYVQFAFKPHPFLKKKLINIWGEEKTNRYYSQWDEMTNCQLVEDSYVDLFKHSDALIHDCDSFTIEYCYMNKPAMFLIHPEQIEERFHDLNRFGQKAFSLHTLGITKKDIYSFVLSVVQENDERKPERLNFYNTSLLPPNGNSAVMNIINSILNEN